MDMDNDETFASITLPAFDLRGELDLPSTSSVDYGAKLFSGNRLLLIAKHEVIIIKGTIITKKLTYEEEIITAMYTSFNNGKNLGGDGSHDPNTDALVVCVSKTGYIYYPDGRSYVVSFPFKIRNAHAFESGLVLERDQEAALTSIETYHPQQFNGAKFLTLVDPIGEFRIVATSSTSVISSNEKLVAFPLRGLNKLASLCATYNTQDGSIILYHIRSSLRNNKRLKPLGNMKKRKHSLLSTPNPSRILDDDLDFNQNIMSVNMEKKRTSTLLSDISSIARMGPDLGFAEPSKIKSNTSLEFPTLRKDMILTRVEILTQNNCHNTLKIHSLVFEDQEGVVVVNTTTKESKVFLFNQSSSKHHSVYSFPCQECLPLNHPRYEGYLIALTNANCIQLVNPFLDIVSPKIDLSGTFSNIKSLISSNEENLVILSESGKNYIIRLVLEPKNEFVLNCLRCFKYLSGSKTSETIWMLWRTSLMLDDSNDEWNALVITILSLTFPFNDGIDCKPNQVTRLLAKARYLQKESNSSYSLKDMIPHIVIALHLLREETRLDCLSRTMKEKLGFLLAQLTTWMGWPESWTDYYLDNKEMIDPDVKFLLVLILDRPPNLFESLASLFDEKIIGYLTFSQLSEESNAVNALITPRTHYVLKLFEVLVSPSYGPSTIVEMMCEYGITQGDLETYPPGVYVPLKEAILVCQENPAYEWANDALQLIGRKDISMGLNDQFINTKTPVENDQPKDIMDILSNALDVTSSISPWDGQAEADRIGITKLIFDYDRRYYEITSLLHQTKTQNATLIVDEGTNEYEVVIMQRELAALVALRTLTIPLGRASLFYSGRKPLLTEKFPIPKFNLNTLIAPTMTNIILVDGTLPTSTVEWGNFHNGVSSGLSISRDAKGISGSWIIFNKPPELNSQHAGFLLGLGLNGHLKKLEEWHIYNYLGPKHPLTSVGLLIGMAASMKGTMDNKLTKVLSVHAITLLPQGANDLNVPIIVQTAGLIGIGLLYCGTQHRRMSEILLSQITSSVFQNDTEKIHEGYRLAAGISLGYVNLGKGNDLSGLNDTHVVDRLLSIAISMKDYQSVEELNKSCCGSIIALGFIYMKTENSVLANKLKVPDTEQLLDYIRPDLLLLRCISKNLIMWSKISNTIDWVESEIPPLVLKKYSTQPEVLDSDQLAYFNILGGTCLSIAIKYASTHDVVARDTILHYLDTMMEITSTVPTNYDQKIAYHGAKNIQNILALSLSVVMSASGDLETLRRLRVMYNNTNKNMGYGDYMAINMALGFLFLAGGQYAISTSDFAIASLVVSLYPIFPNSSSENEVHLQALRNFWALAIEPRCVVIRDVNSQTPCKIPITIETKNGEIKNMLSPCVIPNLEEITMVKTNSPDYFDVEINFKVNSQYLENFKQNLTIYVYKRKNYKLLKSSMGSLLTNANKALQIENGEIKVNSNIMKLVQLKIFEAVDNFEKQVLVYENDDKESTSTGLSLFNIIDDKLDLYNKASNPQTREDLWNLRLLFSFTDRLLNDELHYISTEFIQLLKHQISSIS
jgi:anaphase-promoting complex subunit 1